MSLFKHIIYTFTVIFLCSCAADMYSDYDSIYDSNVTMGNIVEGKFISDQGLSYNIIDQTCEDKLDGIKRAMISCDIINKIDEKNYDIILNDVEEIFTKSPIDSTAVTNEDNLIENPINIGEVWYSGGYLNMLISFPVKKDSSQAHLINLVRNDEKSSTGNHEFTFRHNAFGEIITTEDIDFVLAGRYVSFPLTHFFKQDETNIQIILNWTSNTTEDGVWSAATKKNKICIPVSRTGYEHKHWE